MLGISRSAWLLVVISTILQILAFPLPNLYILSWIAIAPLLVAILSAQRPDTLQLRGEERLLPASLRQAFLLGYVCGILWYAGTCYWVFSTMKQYGGIGGAGAFGLLLLFCLYLALYHGFFALIIALLAKSSTRLALVLSPLFWVAVELARTRISGFPWDLLGTVQADNFALARISRFTGVYGVSFEIMVVNAAFAAALLLRRSRRNRLLLAAIAAAFVLQVSRWMPAPPLPADHTAVLVQENIPVLDNGDWTQQFFDDTVADLIRLSLAPSNGETQHPELVVWPESPAPFYSDDQKFRTWMQALASDKHAYIIAGTLGVNGEGEHRQIYNSASLIAPSGAFVGRYDKIRLVPFGEYVPFENLLFFAQSLVKEVGHFSRGNQRNTLELDGHKAGVFICYESVFPEEVRQFAANGAQVFVNISNDEWFGAYNAPGQHLNMARMRAIENGRWVLRATNSGITVAIDPKGRVVARLSPGLRAALTAPYSFRSETTLYTRYGDWFPWACAIISFISLIFRRRTRSE